MKNIDDSSRFDGSLEPSHRVTLEGRAIAFESGVLPLDFPQRLTRLKEASGLTWSGLSRALGVDPKQMYRWRRGTEPCGGACSPCSASPAGCPAAWTSSWGRVLR